MSIRKLPLLLAAALGSAPFAVGNVYAAAYPSKPIQWLVGYKAGGASDTIARVIDQKLPSLLGQRVIIVNRPGASGIIAGQAVAEAPADGYTLLMVSTGFLTNVALGRKMSFDPIKAFTAVTRLGVVPNIVAVTPKLPVHSVKGLIALAKSEPGKLNYAVGGIGTGTQLDTAMFERMTGTKMTMITYEGTPPALLSLEAGRVQVMLAGAPPALPMVRAGKLRALAVTTLHSSPVDPSLPPVSKTVPGFSGVTWYGVVAPAKVPAPVLHKLSAAFRMALKDPSISKLLLKRGFVAQWSPPGKAEAEMKAVTAKYAKVVKEAGIHIN